MIKTRWGLLGAALALAACATNSGQAPAPDVAISAGEARLGVNSSATDGNLPPEAAAGAIRAVPMPSAPLRLDRLPNRIVFASCAQQNEDQSLWSQIAAENHDLTLMMGDNVYGDVRSNDPAQPELKAAYMRLARSRPFATLRDAAPMLAVWDDHDYGLNDAGADYPFRQDSQALFNYVWNVPADSPRRQRDGIYNSWMFEEDGKRVQLIMLDTRYFRSELKPTDERGAPGRERYVPDNDPAKTMLGTTQWAWLGEELEKPADLRILVSSIQVLAEGHGWEAWRTLPRERDRLYATIREAGAKNVLILSGDRHSAGLYERDGLVSFPLFEATSSSVNLPAARWRAERGETRMEPGPYRLGPMIYEANYGLLDIDWPARAVTVQIKGEGGTVYLSETRRF